MPFLFVFFFWVCYDPDIVMLNNISEVSETVLFKFFFLYSALIQSFPPFYLPGNLSILLLQLISVIVLFIAESLFFNSSRSLLNISCIFSILAPSLFIGASI